MTAVQSNSAFARIVAKRMSPGLPLRTLRQAEFEASCAELMRLVEQDYSPTLVVGIRTGGLVVAQHMAHSAAASVPVLPVTCRRAATGRKSRIPLFRATLMTLPAPVVDILRRLEHRWFIASRAQTVRSQVIDADEVDAVADQTARRAVPSRILLTDDAVDSGITLSTVLHHLRAACPSDTEIRTAVITQTLAQPIACPDYALFHGTLCRFPWSFDARR